MTCTTCKECPYLRKRTCLVTGRVKRITEPFNICYVRNDYQKNLEEVKK